MTAQIRDATVEDCRLLGDTLRQADRDEIAAMSGNHPNLVLLTGVLAGKAWTAVDRRDGEIILMFGTGEGQFPGTGRVWMLASDKLEDPAIAFALGRNSREWVSRMNEDYPALYNFVDARNAVHIRWLQWCGFTFINKHERFGAARVPFYEFVRLREQ